MEHHLRDVLREKGSTVHTIGPEATVIEGVRLMNEIGIGSLLVVDKGRAPVGIFTERDVLRRVVDSRRDPDTTPIHDVMTKEVLFVQPEHTVRDTMRIMTEKRCRHLPVIENDVLLGLISIGDLTRWVTRHQEIVITDLVDYITGSYPVDTSS